MLQGQPSRTALGAAAHRAAHQIFERGLIFSDPLALRILGEDGETIARKAAEAPSARRMRIFVAVRTRIAEDALASAVAGGVSQLVVLGAGLDTYAYRTTLHQRLRIFEVDHPSTQAWKQQRLAQAGIPVPDFLTFVPVNFERETLADGLATAGFDRNQPTFFTWLGVVPYLREEAIWSTLAFIANSPNEAHVVFDYSNPPSSLPPEVKRFHDERAAQVAELGEAWVSYFETEDLLAKLKGLGFSDIEDLGLPQIADRYFPGSVSNLSDRGGHVVRATVGRNHRT